MSRKAKTLILSEVARWSCFSTPYNASSTEIEACAARREQYARSVYDAVAIEQSREGFMSALGKALRRASETGRGYEPPSADSLLRWVRDAMRPRENEPVVTCKRCEDEGGIWMRSWEASNGKPRDVLRGPGAFSVIEVEPRLHTPQRARLLPRHLDEHAKQHTTIPLCGHHVELAAWESYGRSEGYPAPLWYVAPEQRKVTL